MALEIMKIVTVWDVRDALQFNIWRRRAARMLRALDGFDRDDKRVANLWDDYEELQQSMIGLLLRQPRRTIGEWSDLEVLKEPVQVFEPCSGDENFRSYVACIIGRCARRLGIPAALLEGPDSNYERTSR